MHVGGPSQTQNQGNMLGDRPCVRQSKLYREHDGGNAMKEIMGNDGLKWDTQQQQGAYLGKKAFDDKAPAVAQPETAPSAPLADCPKNTAAQPAPGIKQQGHRRGAGMANYQSYNILTGQ